MTGQILFRVALPSALLTLLLVAACLGGMWSIAHLQANQEHILSKNVASLLAAQELELRLRQLRFHSFLYAIEPNAARRDPMKQDSRQFEAALVKAMRAAEQPAEKKLVEAVQTGYLAYSKALGEGFGDAGVAWNKDQVLHWSDAHSAKALAERCEDLLNYNEESMEGTAAESDRVGNLTRRWMLIVGLLGPLSGLIGGYVIARGLSRTLTKLVVRVQDLNAQFDQEVESLGLTAGRRLHDLDKQLDHVVERVRTVVVQAQKRQQEMLRAEQLAAVGQLAAGMAHEVRNPLTSIKLLIGAARRGGPERGLSSEDLQVIHEEIERLEGKVQTLLDFARPLESRRNLCDLREIVTRSVELVKARASEQRVAIETHMPGTPMDVFIDESQLSSVLVNLYFNALDAMPGGGTMTVELVRDDPFQIKVTDTGPGIAQEVADRLFTPFVSSKATGTGLGLSVSRRLVQDQGGALTGGNLPEGPGACFVIRLPRAGEEHASPPHR
jgi:two-component system, NtrC family, sensor histidine kinase HydH